MFSAVEYAGNFSRPDYWDSFYRREHELAELRRVNLESNTFLSYICTSKEIKRRERSRSLLLLVYVKRTRIITDRAAGKPGIGG